MLSKARVPLRVWYRHVFQTNYRYLWMAFVVLYVAILQWLFNFSQLRLILFGSNNLSFGDKIDVFADSFFAVFTYINDWTPVAFISIAVIQSATTVLLIRLRKSNNSSKRAIKQVRSLSVAVIGAGCVACGGSIITPLLGLLASSVSITLAQSIGDFLLLVGLVASVYAFNEVAKAKLFIKGKI